MVGRAALVAAFVAAILLPVASASGASQIKLALLPLPKAMLGPAGHSLSLAPDCGTDPNAYAASQVTGNVTAKLSASDVHSLAQKAAHRLDVAVPAV